MFISCYFGCCGRRFAAERSAWITLKFRWWEHASWCCQEEDEKRQNQQQEETCAPCHTASMKEFMKKEPRPSTECTEFNGLFRTLTFLFLNIFLFIWYKIRFNGFVFLSSQNHQTDDWGLKYSLHPRLIFIIYKFNWRENKYEPFPPYSNFLAVAERNRHIYWALPALPSLKSSALFSAPFLASSCCRCSAKDLFSTWLSTQSPSPTRNMVLNLLYNMVALSMMSWLALNFRI